MSFSTRLDPATRTGRRNNKNSGSSRRAAKSEGRRRTLQALSAPLSSTDPALLWRGREAPSASPLDRTDRPLQRQKAVRPRSALSLRRSNVDDGGPVEPPDASDPLSRQGPVPSGLLRPAMISTGSRVGDRSWTIRPSPRGRSRSTRSVRPTYNLARCSRPCRARLAGPVEENKGGRPWPECRNLAINERPGLARKWADGRHRAGRSFVTVIGRTDPRTGRPSYRIPDFMTPPQQRAYLLGRWRQRSSMERLESVRIGLVSSSTSTSPVVEEAS